MSSCNNCKMRKDKSKNNNRSNNNNHKKLILEKWKIKNK